MSKKIIVGSFFILLVLASGLYYFYKKGTFPLSIGQNSSGSKSTPPPSTPIGNSLKDKAPQICTFSNNSGSGTYYISSVGVRGDFLSSVGDIKSHMILKDNVNYNWADGSKTGNKIKVDPYSIWVPQEIGGADPFGNPDKNVTSNYKCDPWTIDTSKFNLPDGVTFIETAAGPSAPPSQAPSPKP